MMSHLRLAQDCLANGLSSYVVFEDDTVFVDGFLQKLESVMVEIEKLEKGWDLLYLGGQHLYRESCPPWPHAKGLVRCKNVNRTHAFAVNGRCMAWFAQHIIHAPDYTESASYFQPPDADGLGASSSSFKHVDHQLGEFHPRVITLATNPWLCGQGGGNSDISGVVGKEEWWPNKGWGENEDLGTCS